MSYSTLGAFIDALYPHTATFEHSLLLRGILASVGLAQAAIYPIGKPKSWVTAIHGYA